MKHDNEPAERRKGVRDNEHRGANEGGYKVHKPHGGARKRPSPTRHKGDHHIGGFGKTSHPKHY